jgi:hypothetical protein
MVRGVLPVHRPVVSKALVALMNDRYRAPISPTSDDHDRQSREIQPTIAATLISLSESQWKGWEIQSSPFCPKISNGLSAIHNSNAQFNMSKSQCQIPSTQFPIFKTQFGTSNSQFAVHNLQIPIHNSQFGRQNSQLAIHNFQFTIRNSQFAIHNSQFAVWNSQLEVKLCDSPFTIRHL